MDENNLQMQFQIFEQQIMQIQQQLQAIDQAISEITLLENGLNELIGKKDLEMFSSLGKGIFAKTKLISEELLVDVGEKNFVTKSIPETQELIREQLEKLDQVKEELENELENINSEITRVMLEHHQKLKSPCACDSEKECDCKDNCDCEKKP